MGSRTSRGTRPSSTSGTRGKTAYSTTPATRETTTAVRCGLYIAALYAATRPDAKVTVVASAATWPWCRSTVAPMTTQ
ncbi:hypothetical protein [Streptomyces sp. NPDC058548]|uniref:hypothetical protein n=1 Tax=unclassified Streptomyces TaxID=2593676 RepID=UPI00365F13F6